MREINTTDEFFIAAEDLSKKLQQDHRKVDLEDAQEKITKMRDFTINNLITCLSNAVSAGEKQISRDLPLILDQFEKKLGDIYKIKRYSSL